MKVFVILQHSWIIDSDTRTTLFGIYSTKKKAHEMKPANFNEDIHGTRYEIVECEVRE